MNRIPKVSLVFCSVFIVQLAPIAASAVASDSIALGRLTDEMRQRAVQTLRDGLAEQQRWVKVHAAEFLWGLGYPQGVREAFELERLRHGDEMEYRIGIWRVLAMAARTPAEQKEYVANIQAVVRTGGADRLHALESLAKLGVAVDESTAMDIAAGVAQAPESEAVFGRWVLALSGHAAVGAKEQEGHIAAALSGSEALTRLRASFALANLVGLSKESVEAFIEAGDKALASEPNDDLEQLADAYVLASAWSVALANNQQNRFTQRIGAYREELERRAEESTAIARVLAGTLATAGKATDADLLSSWLEHEDGDLRLSSAHALLRLDRRRPGAMTVLDWTVIGVYFLGMICIGLFYAGRTNNTDDFLLGGRHMKSWMVGMSLFATLLSTLTYLAVPGEMIRHGPVITLGMASFPLVAWIVGWFIIPVFMRLQVTSAYEILEARFGYGGRLLGTVMFLLLRFFWMAVILYATTDVVIIPLLGWTSSSTPWICAVLGLITVFYSSLGGLRAVVLTDVIQTGILLTGALIALLVISLRLGGVGAWWPTQWDPGWTPLRFFDATSPRTFLMAFIGTGIWYICTAGSDQMAIQRYLATRDVRAARRMFYITLLMNLLSWGLLTILGFALLGFYRAHPEYLADNTSVATDADKLFPRFIAVGLPMGMSGLVVAGLLAAAMSSLSSGINSSCAVISIDYVARWRNAEKSEPRLRETQLISWGVGAVAVLLSMAAGFVPGNLLEVVYRIGNLLVAPLFVLFFMALFVTRATWPATWMAVLGSIAVAVLVAYGQLIALGIVAFIPAASGLAEAVNRLAAMGVLWIMPLSLLTGIVIGCLGTVLKIGRPAPPLPSADLSTK